MPACPINPRKFMENLMVANLLTKGMHVTYVPNTTYRVVYCINTDPLFGGGIMGGRSLYSGKAYTLKPLLSFSFARVLQLVPIKTGDTSNGNS